MIIVRSIKAVFLASLLVATTAIHSAYGCFPQSPTIWTSVSQMSASPLPGENAPNQTFQVANIGYGTLQYSIQSNQTWLTVGPTSGASTGESDTITVSFPTSTLAEGEYSATITISDPAATNPQVTIPVSLYVGKPPVILRDGQRASGLTFSIPFVSGQSGNYYRQQASLVPSSVDDIDEERDLINGTWNAWHSLVDSTHPDATWSYSPSTITGPCTLTVTCNWTDDNTPSGTQDNSAVDVAYVNIYSTLSAPTNLGGQSVSARRIDLTWADNASNETGYNIFRSTDGSHYSQIKQAAANTTHYEDKGLQAQTTYYYKVRAFSNAANSDYSNVVQVETPAMPIFAETWDRTLGPFHPDDHYATGSNGQVLASDMPWNWATENATVSQTGLRNGTDGKEAGRFAAGSSTGDFSLEAPAGSLNPSEGQSVSASFQVTVDETGTESNRDFLFLYRNETSYTANPTYISIDVSSRTSDPFLKIKSSDQGSVSNELTSSQAISSLGGPGTYRIDTSFIPDGSSLDVSYSVVNESNPTAIALSSTGSLNQIPSENLHQLVLTEHQRSVGAWDNITLSDGSETQQQSSRKSQEDKNTPVNEEQASASTDSASQTFNVSDWPPTSPIGKAVSGLSNGDMAGLSIAHLTDVNGDGVDDVLIGAPWMKGSTSSTTWDPWCGAAYLLHGSATGPQPGGVLFKPVHASTTTGVTATPAIFAAGMGVSDIGDFNGDGISDFAIAAPWGMCDNRKQLNSTGDEDNSGEITTVDDPGNAAGEVYIIFGNSSGTYPVLSQPEEGRGLLVEGINTNDLTGRSIAGVGDVNGDGFTDVLIGAPNSETNGQAFLLLGGASSQDGILQLDKLDADSRVITFTGPAAGSQCGYSVSAAGDVNGDGLMDFLIGAPKADTTSGSSTYKEAGVAYLIYGTTSFDHTAAVNLATLAPSDGLVFKGISAFAHAGYSVSGLGDVNLPTDGYSDIAIGAPDANQPGFAGCGKVYLIYGNMPSSMISDGVVELSPNDLATGAGITFSGATAGEQAGSAIACAGDIHSDGAMDIIIGAPGADRSGYTDAGAVYVVYGTTFTTNQMNLSNLGLNGYSINGVTANERLGTSVAPAGDLNGDKKSDIWIGGPNKASEKGEAIFIPGTETLSGPQEAVYHAYLKPGDADATLIGGYPSLTDSSRCWIDYSAGDSVSLETVRRWNHKSDRSGLAAPTGHTLSQVADAIWKLDTTRTGWNPAPGNPGAIVTLKYTDPEISSLSGSEWGLRLWQSDQYNNQASWSLVPEQTIDPARNLIRGKITGSGKYLILVQTASSPTAEIDVYQHGLISIQKAIASCDAGGKIVVNPGTYIENLSFGGKNLELCSSNIHDRSIIASTIIDGGVSGDVISFAGTEGALAKVEGLTIQHKLQSGTGRGITGNGASPTVCNNLIQYNSSTGNGGAIATCNGIIERNDIRDNKAINGGGISDCNGTIRNNIIYRNQASGQGGGIAYCQAGIWNNTIWANMGWNGSGGISACEGTATIKNNILWINMTADNNGDGYADYPPNLDTSNSSPPEYCCIYGWTSGGNGNFGGGPSDDPLLMFPENGNMRLSTGSSCYFHSGTTSGISVTNDFYEQARPNGAGIDIGAVEYYVPSHEPPAAPGNVSTELLSDNKTVRVSWDSVTGGTGEYNVYVGENDFGPFTLIGSKLPVTYPNRGSFDHVSDPGPRTIYLVTAVGSESRPSQKKDETRWRTIILDPGHPPKGADSGNLTSVWGGSGDSFEDTPPVYPRQLTYEKYLTWDLCCRIQAQIAWYNAHEDARIRVLSTRDLGNWPYMPTGDVSLNARGTFARGTGAQAYVSIHFDANDKYLQYEGNPDHAVRDQYNRMSAYVYSPTADSSASVYDQKENPDPYINAPAVDQFNLPDDVTFATSVYKYALLGYRETSGIHDRELDQKEKHFRPHRDSLLNTGWDPVKPGETYPPKDFKEQVQKNGPKATLLEINFLPNPEFHQAWSPPDDPDSPLKLRQTTADGIAVGIWHYFDNSVTWNGN